jgi:5-oxopent-3-ene-1,2,5-tricarboxylate decarboxylase / 2-hydroxyhepta-2,4-diene-1,7-dioate isomerase
LRFNARDGFCRIGTDRVAASAVSDPDGLQVRVYLDEDLVHQSTTAGRIRPVRRLLADVSEFMTLQTGGLLLLGASHYAPLAAADQRVRVEIDGVGSTENRVERELVGQ